MKMAWEPRTATTSSSFDSDFFHLSQDSNRRSNNYLASSQDSLRIPSPYQRPPGRCEREKKAERKRSNSRSSSEEFYFAKRESSSNKRIPKSNQVGGSTEKSQGNAAKWWNRNEPQQEVSDVWKKSENVWAEDDFFDDLNESKYAVSTKKPSGNSKSSQLTTENGQNKVFRTFLTSAVAGVDSIPSKKLLIGKPKVRPEVVRNNIMTVARTEISPGKKRKIALLSISAEPDSGTKTSSRKKIQADTDSDSDSGRRSCSSSLVVGKKRSVVGPTLDTEIEKNLLSDIFMELDEKFEENIDDDEKVEVTTGSEKVVDVVKKEKQNVVRRGVVPVIGEIMQLNMVGAGLKRNIPACENSVNHASVTGNLTEKVRKAEEKIVKKQISTPKPTSSTANTRAAPGYLDLQSILSSLPDDASWAVSGHDAARASGRYLQRRESNVKKNRVCIRCGKSDHRRGDLCQSSSCTLCHGNDHRKEHCPFSDSVNAVTCTRCFKSGHIDVTCPEIWRQFHSTITPVDPQKTAVVPAQKKATSCGNCGAFGHFAHSCQKKLFDRSASGFPHPKIEKYDAFGSHLSPHEDSPLDFFYSVLSDTSSPVAGTSSSSKPVSPFKNKTKRSMRTAFR